MAETTTQQGRATHTSTHISFLMFWFISTQFKGKHKRLTSAVQNADCRWGRKMLEKKCKGRTYGTITALIVPIQTHAHTDTNTIVVVVSGIVRALRRSFHEKWNPRRRGRRRRSYELIISSVIYELSFLLFLRRAYGAYSSAYLSCVPSSKASVQSNFRFLHSP